MRNHFTWKNLLLKGTLLTCLAFITVGCANTLNHNKREEMSAQPPRYEAPYDQIPQPAQDQYLIDYKPLTLSDTQNETPEPIQIYPENYRSESRNPRVLEQVSRPLEAIPAPGKPGYAISPYAPKAGLVDIRDFPPGSEVKDPYTGRVMLVPVNTEKPSETKKIDKKANLEKTGSPFLKQAPTTPQFATPNAQNPPAANTGTRPTVAPAPPAPVIQQGPPLTPR